MDSILKTESQLARIMLGGLIWEEGKAKSCLLGCYEHCLEHCYYNKQLSTVSDLIDTRVVYLHLGVQGGGV